MDSGCDTCQGLQKHPKALETSQDTDNHTLQLVNTSLPNLRTSATNCKACALLLNGILLHHRRFSGIEEERIRIRAESLASIGRTNQDHLSVEIRWKEQDAHNDDCEDDQQEHVGYPDLKLEYFTDGDGQSNFSAIGRGRHISERPLQDAGLSTARGMINDCVSKHTRCRQAKPSPLPKRVLDVRVGADSKSVALKESQWNDDEQGYEHGEYVALSHVWGMGKRLKTTEENLKSHLKGIAWSTLSNTLQEAVLFTRAINVRYLWVDSLCLIQDDEQAKLEESVRMDEVFGNAYLTIAATSTMDSSTQPLFPNKSQAFKIQATDNKERLSKIYVREQPSHYSFRGPFDEGSHMNEWELPFNMSEDATLHTPLLKRAWAYTERLLSPRVLHFTISEMILECREGYNCECGRIDDKLFDSRATDSIKQEFSRIIHEASTRPPANANGNQADRRMDSMTNQLSGTNTASGSLDLLQKREDALQLWSYIITEFTARTMTYDERLTAIASIAKALSPAMQSGYIAGQWTFSTLSLLWYPTDSAKCRRPIPMDGQDIPTWSWASCEGSPIFCDNATAMDLACRASFGSRGKRASAWSPIQGEPLSLSAAMAAKVTLRVSEQETYTLVKNRIAVDFTPDIVPARGEDKLEDGERLVCVLISMTYRSSITGLVLKAVEGSTYRRVGRFECYDCRPEEGDEMSEDAETLFGYWFPEIQDMTQLDSSLQRQFTVV